MLQDALRGFRPSDDERLREQIDKAWARRATKAQVKARGL